MKKSMSPMGIMNAMGAAAHQKAQPLPDPDEESMTPKAPKVPKSKGMKKPMDPKQIAAIKAKGK